MDSRCVGARIVELFIKVNGCVDCLVVHQDFWMHGLFKCSSRSVGVLIVELFIMKGLWGMDCCCSSRFVSAWIVELFIRVYGCMDC